MYIKGIGTAVVNLAKACRGFQMATDMRASLRTINGTGKVKMEKLLLERNMLEILKRFIEINDLIQ